MKILSLCIILVLLFGCKTSVKPVKNRDIVPDPVNFSWIRNAKVLNLETVDIYYKGVAKGEFVGNKQWQGRITGEIFCKPLEADRLQDGFYIENGTIEVNKNSTIEIETEWIFTGKIMSFSKKDVCISNGRNIKMSGKAIRLKLPELKEKK